MRSVVRSSLLGPFPVWESLKAPPAGYKWVYLTSLEVSFELESGGKICFPHAYLKRLPLIGLFTYRQYKAEIDAMIDDASEKQKPGKWTMPADPFLKGHPTLAQYLTDFWWEKPAPKPRIPCKLAIQFFGESVQVSLNDEEKRRSMHTTAPSVSEALQLMEDRLSAGNAPWRNWGNQKK